MSDRLRQAAAVLRSDPTGDVALAVAALLDRCAEAQPIDMSEPPRNPRDRSVIYAALALAEELLCDAKYERPGGREHGDRIVRCGRANGHDGLHREFDDAPEWEAP